MGRPDLSTNPFSILQSRYLILGTFLLASIATGQIYGYLARWQLLPWPWDDPISQPIFSIAIALVQTAVIIWASRDYKLDLSRLFKPWPKSFSATYTVLLVFSLLLFSMGSFLVVFYPIATVLPDYALGMLRVAGKAQYPQTYKALSLFVSLVSAPLVEELVFRGILLQRWATKWGLREGLIVSSVLFGVLHPNNPVGLTMFGLVMGLLYLRTGSLWVPVVCHGLNNLVVAGIGWVTQPTESLSVAATQGNWGWGVLLVVVSAPLLLRFVWRSWPQPKDDIPYLRWGSEGVEK